MCGAGIQPINREPTNIYQQIKDSTDIAVDARCRIDWLVPIPSSCTRSCQCPLSVSYRPQNRSLSVDGSIFFACGYRGNICLSSAISSRLSMAATMTAHKQLPSIVEYLDLPQFRRLVPDLPRATALCPDHIDRKIVPCRSTALRVDTQRHYLHFVRHFAPTVNGSDDAMKFKVRKAESIILGKNR